VTAFLLDVNVLVALGWRGHSHHSLVTSWFARHCAQGWATSPFTQSAFVRIVSNPAFSAHAVPPTEAMTVLATNLSGSGHQFWADDLPLEKALSRFGDRIVGHQQITGAYLLGLAIHRKGKLATLDRSILDLLPQGSPHRASVALIGK
jgi:uncharacterized protein